MKAPKITVSFRIKPEHRDLICLIGDGSFSKGVEALLQTLKSKKNVIQARIDELEKKKVALQKLTDKI